jgi:hypothetical protein
MKRILESEIIEELLVCPYCGDPKTCEDRGCCGESSCHFERAFATKDEVYLESEVVVYDDAETMAEEQKIADEIEAEERAQFKASFERKYDKP